MRIAFVYHGSAGISGGYTSKFLEALSLNEKTYAFVNFNYNYKFRDVNLKLFRIFFPITDKYLHSLPVIRKIVRYIELLLAYFIILIFALFLNFDKFIYNPITNLKITYVFNLLYKHLVVEYLVVVHDAQSHYHKTEKYRDGVFLLASRLIFHNYNSKAHLNSRLKGISNSNLLWPFPWSLERLNITFSETVYSDLLFIGHVRPSKGLDFFLEGYKLFQKAGGVLELCISGKMSNSDQKKALNYISNVKNKIFSDDEFIMQLKCSKFVVLPYMKGYSNSSVHFCSIIHAGTPFICSDIELFDEFQDKLDCLKFKHDDLNSLVSTLKYAQGLSEEGRLQLSVNSLLRIQSNMSLFDQKLKEYLKDFS